MYRHTESSTTRYESATDERATTYESATEQNSTTLSTVKFKGSSTRSAVKGCTNAEGCTTKAVLGDRAAWLALDTTTQRPPTGVETAPQRQPAPLKAGDQRWIPPPLKASPLQWTWSAIDCVEHVSPGQVCGCGPCRRARVQVCVRSMQADPAPKLPPPTLKAAPPLGDQRWLHTTWRPATDLGGATPFCQEADTHLHERLRRMYIDGELDIDSESATSQATSTCESMPSLSVDCD